MPPQVQSNRAKQLWTESLYFQRFPRVLCGGDESWLTQKQVTDRTPPCQRWNSAYSCTTECLDQIIFELIRVWNCDMNLPPNTKSSFWSNITWKKYLVSTFIWKQCKKYDRLFLMDYCSTDNKYPDSNRSLLLFQSLGSFLQHTVKHSRSGIRFCCDQNDSEPLRFFRQPLIPFRILRLLQILQTDVISPH